MYSVPFWDVTAAATHRSNRCPACNRSNVPPTETLENRRVRFGDNVFLTQGSVSVCAEVPSAYVAASVVSITTTSLPGLASDSARTRARCKSHPHWGNKGVNGRTGANRAIASHTVSRVCTTRAISASAESSLVDVPDTSVSRNSTSKCRRSNAHNAAVSSTICTLGGEPTTKTCTPPPEFAEDWEASFIFDAPVETQKTRRLASVMCAPDGTRVGFPCAE
mmetsp:Transcript_10364/g.38472  ORF Transcript_10364/g.38472 Transcript_10364/m.38472 type:complete len:221 (+) Transcript_10364:2112-2774(+)